MIINRIINKLHPMAPKGWIVSLQQHIDDGKQPECSSYHLIEAGACSRLNREALHPICREDYFLDIDVENHFSINFEQKNLYSIKECRVVGSQGDIIFPNGSLLAEFTTHNGLGANHSLFSRRRFGAIKQLTGQIFNLATPFSSNYYHWLLEALPSLRTMRTGLDSIDIFVIPKAGQFHRQSLNLLGIADSQILELDDQSHYICEQLLLTGYDRKQAASPNAIEWLRSELSPNNTVPNTVGRRIYISRGDSGWRSVVNEAEVIEYLERFGFESVELSTLGFKEQIDLFSSASHIVSVHGAGLSNAVFCRAKTKVLEIHPPRWTSVCYAHLCSCVGIDYYYCNAEAMGLSDSQIKANKSYIPLGVDVQGEELVVPMDKIAKFIAEHVS